MGLEPGLWLGAIGLAAVPKYGSVAIRLALIVPLIGLWLVAYPEPSYACSCVTPGPPSAALAGSAAVFRGKVVSIREFDRGDGIWGSADPTTVEFDVKTVWKGPNYETLYLTTARSESSCGFSFIEGIEYVVYSRDGATVSLCSRTRALSKAADDLAELGQGQAPAPGTIAPTPDVSGRQTAAPGSMAPTPDTSGRQAGGCGRSPHSQDISFAGLLAVIAWLGVRKRRPEAREPGDGQGQNP